MRFLFLTCIVVLSVFGASRSEADVTFACTWKATVSEVKDNYLTEVKLTEAVGKCGCHIWGCQYEPEARVGIRELPPDYWGIGKTPPQFKLGQEVEVQVGFGQAQLSHPESYK